jgi:4-hydroxy-tetrahydrodipicolinate synthase
LTKLYSLKNIVGIKEASGNLEVIKDIRKSAPTRYSILSGDDETFVEAMTCGANGVISVISHVIPKICLGATASQKSIIIDVSKALFCETNPIPVKWALFKMGIIRKPEVRLPLVELDPMYYNVVSDTLKKVGVL